MNCLPFLARCFLIFSFLCFPFFADVEELSTKLMAKLAEVQSLEGGTFFIGNADALRIPTTTTMTTAAATFNQPQHVMLPGNLLFFNFFLVFLFSVVHLQ